jgi:hypothetical protein
MEGSSVPTIGESLGLDILFLLLPGLVGWKLFTIFTGKHYADRLEAVGDIFLFSLGSYLAFFLCNEPSVMISRFAGTTPGAIGHAGDALHRITWPDVFGASIASVGIGILSTLFKEHSLLNRLGIWLKISHRYGGDDVWVYFWRELGDDWSFVRDRRLGLLYYGSITSYSESGSIRELVITNVSVHDNSTGKQLYETARMYIARESNELSIESPSGKAKRAQ